MMTWLPAPGMLKRMVSAPGLALALVMAWRNDPGPASLVLLTVKTAGAVRSSRRSNRGRAEGQWAIERRERMVRVGSLGERRGVVATPHVSAGELGYRTNS